jgi:hypothetical protein
MNMEDEKMEREKVEASQRTLFETRQDKPQNQDKTQQDNKILLSPIDGLQPTRQPA